MNTAQIRFGSSSERLPAYMKNILLTSRANYLDISAGASIVRFDRAQTRQMHVELRGFHGYSSPSPRRLTAECSLTVVGWGYGVWSVGEFSVLLSPEYFNIVQQRPYTKPVMYDDVCTAESTFSEGKLGTAWMSRPWVPPRQRAVLAA